ncbi:hypothetical protein EVAR_66348_1 [Eumeta japonica]|uniref:Uncharacterized protein n=1 Tax=Eumeta variegata TaxID=151549 RepID=A0A4C2A656_EUMVA|nr:hypothetical protein EVAR_66348_1 [Eumeta japonica]
MQFDTAILKDFFKPSFTKKNALTHCAIRRALINTGAVPTENRVVADGRYRASHAPPPRRLTPRPARDGYTRSGGKPRGRGSSRAGVVEGGGRTLKANRCPARVPSPPRGFCNKLIREHAESSRFTIVQARFCKRRCIGVRGNHKRRSHRGRTLHVTFAERQSNRVAGDMQRPPTKARNCAGRGRYERRVIATA